MISFNKYIILFFVFVAALIMSVLQFVQSERFSEFLVKEIKTRFLEDTGMTLTFESTHISLLPPVTSFRNVGFKYEENEQSVTVDAKEISIEFSFINMLASDIVLESIGMTDAKVDIVRSVEENDDTKKLSIEDVTAKLERIVEDVKSVMPIQVNEINLKRVYLTSDLGSGFINGLEVKIYSNFLVGFFEINELYHPGEFEDITLNAIDSIAGDFEVSKAGVDLKNVKLKNKLNTVDADIKFQFSDQLFDATVSYSGGLEGQMERLLAKYNQKASAYVESELKINGTIHDYKGELELSFFDLKTNYLEAEQVEIVAQMNKGEVIVNKFNVVDNNGSVKLISPVVVFNLNEKKITSAKVSLQAENFHSNSALFAIRNALDVMKTRISGRVDVGFDASTRLVKFALLNGLRLTDFSLELGGQNPLLSQESIRLPNGGLVTLNIDNSLVRIDTVFNFKEESKIVAVGEIGLGKIDIKIKDSFLNFKELGPISGFEMEGAGPFEMKISGPLDNVKFDFDLKHKEFSLLGFNLEDVSGQAELTLKPLKLSVKQLEGQYVGAKYRSSGIVDFAKEAFLLDVEIIQMNYAEMKHMLKPVADLVPELPLNLSFQSKGKFKVAGTFKQSGLDVSGSMSAKHIFYEDEDIEDLSFALVYKNNSLSLKDIILRKSASSARGAFGIDFTSSFFEYDISWSDIQLSDWNMYNQLNLGLSSKLDLDFYGSGQFKDFITRTQAILRESSIQGTSLDDSLITVFNESSEFYVNAAVFGRMFELDSYVNTEGTKAKDPSRINARINMPDIRILLGLISSHNITNSNLEGELASEIKATFNYDKMDEMDLTLVTNEFYFNMNDLAFRPSVKQLRLQIDKGRFVGNELDIVSNRGYFLRPNLRGSLVRGISLNTSFNLPASLISLISPDIAVSSGSFVGTSVARGKINNIDHRLELSSKEVALQIPQVPGIFENLNLDLILDNKNLSLPRATANYGKGKIDVSGQGVLDFPFPSLNLEVTVDNSYISFMKRSGGVISGRANLTGTRPPYLIQGHVDILFAEVVENINDFQATGTQTSSYQRFLPRQDGSGAGQPFVLDLTFSILRPLLVRNSLLELNVEGGASVKGTPRTPLIEGQFNAIPASSKFKFKGHEFNLTKGTVEIGRTFQREGALLDFSGVAQINEYRVRLDVSGRTKNVAVALSSEPNLSQEDIFSLLTLGVTSEISTELEESERQSVATVGLGALLADQLRLNEGLDSSFGLRLSVAPEYAEETTSLLQGKSAVSDSTTSKFRSSTRIRLQKKVSERVDLSVSSTVGGSLEQRQEMNINYRINNRWSLEGVYELKSTEDEGVETSDSVGADLKYRWTF